jgi:hypothetical protein
MMQRIDRHEKRNRRQYEQPVEQDRQPVGRSVYESIIPLAFVLSFFCVVLCGFISSRAVIFAIALFGYGWLAIIVGAWLLG